MPEDDVLEFIREQIKINQRPETAHWEGELYIKRDFMDENPWNLWLFNYTGTDDRSLYSYNDCHGNLYFHFSADVVDGKSILRVFKMMPYIKKVAEAKAYKPEVCSDGCSVVLRGFPPVPE